MKTSDKQQPDACCTVPGSETREQSSETNSWLKHWKPTVSFLMLFAGLVADYVLQIAWFTGALRLTWYGLAYLPVGLPVLKQAVISIKNGDIFTEFFLMGLATICAFLIGEYPEGVAVMLFYSVGEAFQQGAANRARQNIRALLDVRPNQAQVKRNGNFLSVAPESVETGEIVRVKPGERVPLDGRLLSGRASFDTSALTGESKPRRFETDDTVLSGMINLTRVIEIEVTKLYRDSSIARILELVQNAASRKAKTELFIRSFAKVYTPAVVFLAALLVVVPAFFVSGYVFEEWLYRGLVFLVISCPCALVISIPLGYFGGIGAASRNGILVKGGNFLDALRSVKTVVFDKTGTLTKGTFEVSSVDTISIDREELLTILQAVEKNSTHPVAKAITAFADKELGNMNGTVSSQPAVEKQEEIPGYGLRTSINGRRVLVGSKKLMEKEQIATNGAREELSASVVHIAIDGQHAGVVTISDELKRDAAGAIKELRKSGVNQTAMLSGDKQAIAEEVGNSLKIGHVYGDLLPGEKANKLEEIKKRFPGVTVYVGDGINDAPVLAISDVGIAMGAMGSDVAVETADVVIQTDQLTKLATAIKIGKATRNIVWQNIGMALGVKILVLILGAFGLATLWEAVFADVGVALLAILNAVRIQRMEF
ncbi:MAG: heavy metal translocating P-type ATPase [Bacteroidota bacterium]